MRNAPRITVIIVNFFSKNFVLRAVESVLGSTCSERVDVHVVDNSVDAVEQRYLEEMLSRRVTLIFNSENIGFARACNQVFENTRSDYVFLLNPDAYLVGDALLRLQQTLEQNPGIGAVSPQAFWDENLKFYIPPPHYPLLFFLQPELSKAGLNSFQYRLVQRWWRKHCIQVWQSRKLCTIRNICGGHVLLRRTALEKAGGLFDPDFFVYFEDTDLFFRLQKAGFQSAVLPQARAVHHYNQCDMGNWERKGQLMHQSLEVFLRKHSNHKTEMIKKMVWILSSFKGNQAQTTKMNQININSPKELSPPLGFDSWLLEWSPNPDFIPSVGYFGHGHDFLMPVNCIDKLAPGKYYFRFGPSGTGKKWETGTVLIWTKN